MKFKLKKIETLERKRYCGTVYDLTVDKDHSYNINGVIVHNSICSTRLNTGHGVPLLQNIFDIAEHAKNFGRGPNLIADGGIRNSGDIVKAIAAGADMIMTGRLFSATLQTPGALIMDNGRAHKTYRGMASKEAQKEWRSRVSSYEGVSTMLEYRGDAADIIHELESNIRSGLSYSGANDLSELFTKARFVRQTNAGMLESDTHILHK